MNPLERFPENRGVFFPPSGMAAVCCPEDGKKWTLAELQQWIGGYIELVKIADGFTLVLDEDGQAKKLPINMHFSKYGFVGPALLIKSQSIDE